jgi:hypothetical protein
MWLRSTVNNNLDPAFAMTKPKTLSITVRAFNTLVKSSFLAAIAANDRQIRAGKIAGSGQQCS